MADFEILPPVSNKMTFVQLSKTVPSSWKSVFDECIDEFQYLDKIIKTEVFPEKKNVFRAFDLTPLEQVKVVLIGHEPYHDKRPNGKPRAQGLAYSIAKDDDLTPALQNIFQELETEYPENSKHIHGDLSAWARQGVLLLNSSLTIEPGKLNSHGVIWHGFISKVFQAIAEVNKNCIYLLWGNHAKEIISDYIPESSVKLFTSSPFGFAANKGFIGCGHFKEVNRILTEKGMEPIEW